MKIAIIGTGGVGGYYGGLLARTGEDVTFVARGEQYQALKQNGLSVRSVDSDFKISPVKVIDSVTDLESPDLILITTKTYDRDNVAQQLSRVVKDSSTIIISLQNGIDNDLQIKKLLPVAKIYPGLTYIISARTAPAVIEQTAGPRTILFGERNNPENTELKIIEGVMRKAGIRASACADIDRELWTKFLWITTFAGMTALCRSSIGLIVKDEAAFALYIKCLDEGISVARAEGFIFSAEDRQKIIDKSEQYKNVGSDSKSSLLIDMENKRSTEIEALNGAIVRLAIKHGLQVPVHEAIYNSVRISSLAY